MHAILGVLSAFLRSSLAIRERRAFATLVSLSFLESNSACGDGGVVEVFLSISLDKFE